MAFTILTAGSFTSTGVGVKIPLPSSADYFRTWNITQLAAASPTAVVGNAIPNNAAADKITVIT